jgi:hypothetical protein
MPRYLVYIETLDSATLEIKRAAEPVGWCFLKGSVSEKQAKARQRFEFAVNQRPYLLEAGILISKITRVIDRAEKSGNPKSFVQAWREVSSRPPRKRKAR